MAKFARVRVAAELVASALLFPDGASIRGATYDPVSHTLELVVDSPDFADKPDSAQAPVVSLQYRIHSSTGPFGARRETVEFSGWGP
jgi:hypothetical protein